MNKKKYITFVFTMFMAFSLTSTLTSCKVKEGCQGAEELQNSNIDKRTGQLSTKRGSSNLFDKKRVSKSKKRKG